MWGDQRRHADRRRAELRLDAVGQFGDLRESDQSQRRRAHDPGGGQSEFDRRLCGDSGGDQRLGSAAARCSKGGAGTLYLQGSASNTYSGATTIQGTLVAAKTGGAIAIPGNVTLSETGYGVASVLQLNGNNELASSCVLTFNAPLGGSRLDMNGHAQTLRQHQRRRQCGDRRAVGQHRAEHRQHADGQQRRRLHALPGAIRNSLQGSGTGKVNLIKSGGGSLLLGGVNTYTGTTTVSGGTLQVTGSILSSSAVSVGRGRDLVFQPHRRLSGLCRSDHRLGHGADLPRGARFQCAVRAATRR